MPSYFITGAAGNRPGHRRGTPQRQEELRHSERTQSKRLRGLRPLRQILERAPCHYPIRCCRPESIKRGVTEATALLPSGLDYLIHNAGVNFQPLTPFEELDSELFASEVNHSTVVPVQIGNAFLPLIRKSTAKKFTIITSQLGSLEISPHFASLAGAYSVSKAALNMLARKWGATLKTEGITTILIHPGWVHTDIGDTIDDWVQNHTPELVSGKLTPQQSARAPLKSSTRPSLRKPPHSSTSMVLGSPGNFLVVTHPGTVTSVGFMIYIVPLVAFMK
ncbi:hypothetical protein BD779DRAFT_1803795 [Infundibulicybe gibba]|nr:hypothetical protein BD779DRAFT_1803795 [Infundibulicybe gibba]